MKQLLSKQAGVIYRLLLKKGSFSAQEIGEELNILPNAVYRIADELSELGLIEEINSYPKIFHAKSVIEAAKNYSHSLTDIFLKNFQFLNQNKQPDENNQPMAISFIQSRTQLLEMAQEDTKSAQKSVDHIVSGMEVPAETMLSYKNALSRGVRLRFLVQNLNELNKDMMKNWQKMGLELKYYPILEARFIIFDSKILYLTSYNPKVKEESIGVRFAYTPIAREMSDLFERRWQKAKPILI